MSWFGGWTVESKDAPLKGVTLVHAIDALRLPPKPTDKPLRFVVHESMKVAGVGVVVAGRLDAGELVPGMKLVFAPGGAVGEVVSIERHHKELKKALPGDSVGVHVTGLTGAEVKRGHVAGDASLAAPRPAVSFVAQVMVLVGDALHAGYAPVVDCHVRHVSCKFRQILARVDRKTGATLEEFPAAIKAGDTALVELVPLQPLVVEPFAESAMLGRFAMRDRKRVVGIGMVKSVTYLDVPGSAAPKPAAAAVPAEAAPAAAKKKPSKF